MASWCLAAEPSSPLHAKNDTHGDNTVHAWVVQFGVVWWAPEFLSGAGEAAEEEQQRPDEAVP